jgi:hypothetical protein
MSESIEGLDRYVAAIGPGPRATLLRLLEAPEEERAEFIGRIHIRADGELLAELLIELEEKEWAREAAIEALREWGDG